MSAVPTRQWLRRAGRSNLPDGSTLIWSVAEGTRGRRWRAVASADGRVTHALLLEVAPSGRPSRLELSTVSGLLTLHPEADGRSAHGNVVHIAGVRPLTFAWSPEHDLEIVERPVATAVMLRRLARTIAIGDGETVPVLSIDASLTVRPGSRLVRRLGAGRWVVADIAGGREMTLELDGDGIPVGGSIGEWPLDG